MPTIDLGPCGCCGCGTGSVFLGDATLTLSNLVIVTLANATQSDVSFVQNFIDTYSLSLSYSGPSSPLTPSQVAYWTCPRYRIAYSSASLRCDSRFGAGQGNGSPVLIDALGSSNSIVNQLTTANFLRLQNCRELDTNLLDIVTFYTTAEWDAACGNQFSLAEPFLSPYKWRCAIYAPSGLASSVTAYNDLSNDYDPDELGQQDFTLSGTNSVFSFSQGTSAVYFSCDVNISIQNSTAP